MYGAHTQLLRGEKAGILRHKSRMTRIMMTQDCKPFALAWKMKTKSESEKETICNHRATMNLCYQNKPCIHMYIK